MAATSGTPKARALGNAMRQAREKRSKSVRQLATKIGWSHVTVGTWEKGEAVPRTEQLAAYLQALDVVGDERDEILDLALGAGDPNWLAPGMNEHLSAVLEYERTATSIFAWEPLQVPGLLQTGDYARAMFAAEARTPAQLDTSVMLRIGRSDVLTRAEPVDGIFVIGEAALRVTLGSDAIMAHQIRHLLTMDERANVTVRYLPFGTGRHPGMAGPFHIYRFREQSPIVYLEHYRSAAFPHQERDVLDYEAAADTILALALSGQESRAALERALEERETR